MKTSILIPAHNEAAYLPACLEAVIASEPVAGGAEVIVIANGCTDDTAQIARDFAVKAEAAGWTLIVLDLAQGGKLNAWNQGEAAASGEVLIYLDADVVVSPPLMTQLSATLDVAGPRYASGSPNVTITGKDALTRNYTRFWLTTPFMVHGVPGFGVFAMNRAGRARWGAWPDIISDDTFARLNFAPEERHRVPASYDWPMIEGFAALVQVRRRQDIGVAEIENRYPELIANDDPHDRTVPLWKRAVRDPVAFVTFALVRSAIRLPVLKSDNRWVRGR
ncbi:Glycosyl transferase, group 2 family protein [Sulfitobacter noctilucicola]|uniref:Glycosyltransferase involved in cell wall biosynthesis n=1 Tax=Sulfitobacter noctilucicola TaxID=1342301 RepID=A0A7W6Q469_9RHOB|nr:glycosyltransferase family 2 protein [Sulfitobacter noctilucicola]KIN64472.1 Glycosyl transferase, group 2 family protein [Sulfitobacter noctilucicola]MBB4174368.1 glycosyltransferase involved in cell wall biosynthesis [Sulfitobacter noctilucicola]